MRPVNALERLKVTRIGLGVYDSISKMNKISKSDGIISQTIQASRLEASGCWAWAFCLWLTGFAGGVGKWISTILHM